MKKYYDPEYDRIVTQDEVRRQFDYFNSQPWFSKTYEQFRDENFLPEEYNGLCSEFFTYG